MKRDMVNNVLKAWTSRHASSSLFDYSTFYHVHGTEYKLAVKGRSNMDEELRVVGRVDGTLETANIFFPQFHEDCREDMRKLAETYPDLIVKDGFVSVVEVEDASLNKLFHNQGVGLSMYLNFAKRM
jgi:hypothetical protein